MDKYINDKGEVAVLISPCYGAGWSTWNNEDYREFFLMDKTLVQMKMDKTTTEVVEQYCNQVTKQEIGVCMSGWTDVDIYWVKKGSAFIVTEYDGAESFELVKDLINVA